MRPASPGSAPRGPKCFPRREAAACVGRHLPAPPRPRFRPLLGRRPPGPGSQARGGQTWGAPGQDRRDPQPSNPGPVLRCAQACRVQPAASRAPPWRWCPPTREGCGGPSETWKFVGSAAACWRETPVTSVAPQECVGPVSRGPRGVLPAPSNSQPHWRQPRGAVGRAQLAGRTPPLPQFPHLAGARPRPV